MDINPDQDINTLGPSQEPQEPRPLLAPKAVAETQEPDGLGFAAWEEGTKRIASRKKDSLDHAVKRQLRIASRNDPDIAAEAQSLGADLGISPHLVESNMAKVRQLYESRKLDAKMRSGGDTLLMRSLLDPGFASVAHDDLDNLGIIDAWSVSWEAGDIGRQISRLEAKRMLTGDGEHTAEDKLQIDKLKDRMSVLPSDTSGQGFFSLVYGMARMGGGMWDSGIVTAAAAGAGFMVAGPAGAAWLGGEAMFMTSGHQIAGEAYGAMRDLGISHEEAWSKAMIAGAAGGALEAGALMTGVGAVASRTVKGWVAARAAAKAGNLLSRMTVRKALTTSLGEAAKGIGAEIGTELAQELTQWGLTTQAMENEGIEDTGQRGDLMENLGHTFWETLRGVAILGSWGPAIQFKNNTIGATRGISVGKQLNELRKGLKESKVVKRSRNKFLSFLSQSISEKGGAEELYFDIIDFTKSMAEADITMEELRESHPEVAAKIEQADADGMEMITIPTAEFGVDFLQTEFGKSITPHARADPGGMTAEQGVLHEHFEQAGKDLLADTISTTDEFRGSVRDVKKARFDQLVKAGRHPRQAQKEATYMGHLVAGLADHTGKSPQAVVDEYFGKVVKETQAHIDAKKLAQVAPEFVQDPHDAKAGNVLVELNVGAVDAVLPGDRRIGPDGEGAIVDSTGTSRYDRFSVWERGEPTPGAGRPDGMPGRQPDEAIIAPTMGFSDSGVMWIDNGRHRFAVLRDQGRRVFASMPPADAARAREQGLLVDEEVSELGGIRSSLSQMSIDLPPTVEPKLTKEQKAKLKELKAAVPGLGKLLRWLQPDELVNLTMGRKAVERAQELVRLMGVMPRADEMAAVAVAGRSKKGWYVRSAKAIIDIFGVEDAPRFAALLAALSPQTSVEANLTNTLKVWSAWVKAGRPTNPNKIKAIMGKNVQGSGTEKSVLHAWFPNAVTALQAKDPRMAILSGPKVQSFQLNLRGFVNEITNDAWMANYAFVDQNLFGNDKSVQMPGKGAGYMAMSIRARQAAAKLGWTGEEIQETVWSFTKALYEGAYGSSTGGKGAGVSTFTFLTEGMLTHEDIDATPDFDILFRDPEYAGILRDGGYAEQLKTLGSVAAPVATGPVYDAEDKGAGLLRRAAKRLDKLFKKRVFDKTRHEVLVNLSAATNDIPGIKDLYALAESGDAEAHAELQRLAREALVFLTDQVDSTKIEIVNATGLYKGEIEPALGVTVSFQEKDRAKMLLVLRQFAVNFRQEQFHVRGAIGKKGIGKLGKTYKDGSFNTGVRRWTLKKPMSREEAQKVIDDSGLVALTFSDSYAEVYFVGDPTDAKALKEFKAQISRAEKSIGANVGGVGSGIQRLWPYGSGYGARIGYVQIAGEFSPANQGKKGADRPNPAAGRIATRLAGRTVEPVVQAEELTDEQRATQVRIAEAYADMADDNLADPNVRRAYDELADELRSQYRGMTARVEIYKGKGQPYATSVQMRRDINAKNKIQIFATIPEQYGPKGATYDNHPLLADSGEVDIWGEKLLLNDLLRAVHDYYAHSMETTSFGPLGEEAAWATHMAMTRSPWARWALTTETRGQNSWVNFNPKAEGVKAKKRPYADQKVDLLPLEFVLTGNPDIDSTLGELPGSEELNLQPIPVTEGGNPKLLAHGETKKERGYFIPETRETVLTEEADESTVLHEMFHEYVNALFLIAADGHAPPEVLANVDSLLAYWQIPGSTPEERLVAWNQMTFEEQAPHQESAAYNYELWLFTARAPTPRVESLFTRIRLFMLGAYTSLDRATRQLEGTYRSNFGADLPGMTPSLGQMFERMVSGEALAAKLEATREMSPMFTTEEEFVAAGNSKQQWQSYQQKVEIARQKLITDLNVDSVRAMEWQNRARAKVLADMQRMHEDKRKKVEKEMTEEVNAEGVYRLIALLKGKDGVGAGTKLDKTAVMDMLKGLDEEALAAATVKLKGLLVSRKLVAKEKPSQSDKVAKAEYDKLRKWQEKQKADYPHSYRKSVRSAYDTKKDPVTGKVIGKEHIKMSWEEVELSMAHLQPAAERVEEIQTRPDTHEVRGMSPEDVAEFFADDFKNGKELVGALIRARPIAEEIESRTDAEMEKRYGDPLTPEEQEHRVNQLVHSEARARFVAAELKFLQGATKPWRDMLQAAKDQAMRILASTKLVDMDPRVYAQLEARAARRAIALMKPVKARAAWTDKNGVVHDAVEARGADLEGALDAKSQQLLYNQLAKLAGEARVEVTKAKKGIFKSVAKGSKTRDVNVVHAARAILAQYGLVSNSVAGATANFMKLLKQYSPEVFMLFEGPLANAQRAGQDADGDYQNLTFDEFRVMRELIESIWYQAKTEKEMTVAGKKEKVTDIIATLKEAALNARAREDIPGATQKIAGLKGMAWWKHKLVPTRTTLTKLEHYLRELDGGERGGPFVKYLYMQVKEAIDIYRADATEHTKRFVDSLQKLRAEGFLDGGPIQYKNTETGELIYEFANMTELLGALAHTGNRSSMNKMLVAGRGGEAPAWVDVVEETGEIIYDRWNAFVEKLVNDRTLVKAHFDYLQFTWDLMEEIKPKIQKAHIKIMGFPFQEVDALAFHVKFKDDDGVETTVRYRGGYVPANLDHERAREIAESGSVELTYEQMKEDFLEGIPKVASGFTITRTGATKRPLTMDMTHILGHIDKTLRYAHVAPVTEELNSLVNHPDFQSAFAKVDPRAVDEIIKPFIDKAVTQSLYRDGNRATADFFKHARRMVGIKIMAGNVVNTLQQFTGVFNALLYVKARHIKAGLWALMTHRLAFVDMIAGQSLFMKDRMKNQMFDLSDDMREIVLDRSTGEKFQAKAMKWAYFLQATAQNMVDMVVWQAGFEQAMEDADGSEGFTELNERAVREADQAVRLSQGSFSPEDVADYEKGTPAGRTWTQFTSYFNTVLNQVYYANHKGGKGETAKAVTFAFLIPMIVADGIARSFYDKWEDEDDDGHIDAMVYADLFLMAPVRGASAMLPAFGPMAMNMLDLTFSDRAFGDRVAATASMTTIARSALGTLGAIRDLTNEEKEFKSRELRDILSLVAIYFPYGGAALAPLVKPISYAGGVALGEQEPQGAWDLASGLMTGYASKASKEAAK